MSICSMAIVGSGSEIVVLLGFEHGCGRLRLGIDTRNLEVRDAGQDDAAFRRLIGSGDA